VEIEPCGSLIIFGRLLVCGGWLTGTQNIDVCFRRFKIELNAFADRCHRIFTTTVAIDCVVDGRVVQDGDDLLDADCTLQWRRHRSLLTV
jgi:hypothetical protein